MRQPSRIPTFQSWIDYLGGVDRTLRRGHAGRLSVLNALKIEDDPEAIFQEGWLRCEVGEYEKGLPYLQRAVAKGYRRADAFHLPSIRPAPGRSGLRGGAAGR